MTFEFSLTSGWVLLATVVVVCLGAIAGLAGRYRVPGLSLSEQCRAIPYLVRYDAALEYYGLRRRRINEHVRELRANLVDSATDGGIAAAIRRLGPPRKLAAATVPDRPMPSWARGGYWFLAAFLGCLWSLILAADAFADGLAAARPDGGSGHWSGPLGVSLDGRVDGDGHLVAVELSPGPWVLLLFVLVFLVGARAWRVWTGRPRAQVDARQPR